MHTAIRLFCLPPPPSPLLMVQPYIPVVDVAAFGSGLGLGTLLAKDVTNWAPILSNELIRRLSNVTISIVQEEMHEIIEHYIT
jgi:hypothetical protein